MMDAKIKFNTHGGTDLEDVLFTESFLIFIFGVKGEAKAVASELKKKKQHSEVKHRYWANQNRTYTALSNTNWRPLFLMVLEGVEGSLAWGFLGLSWMGLDQD